MKVFQIVNNLDCGGLEKLTIDLSVALKHKGYECVICCIERKGELAEQAENQGVRVISCERSKGGGLPLILKIRSLIKKEGADVVHTHNLKPLIYGTVAGRFAGIKSIVHTRHGREEDRAWPIFWLWNMAIVAIGEDAKKRMLSFNKIDRSKVSVIYNGIKIENFQKGKRPLQNDSKVIGTIGRLAIEKDQENLIRAFARVKKRYPSTQLQIVGDGSLKDDLEALVQRLRLQHDISFLGFQKDVAGVLGKMDIFVLPSQSEGISLTLLEAMAASKPIVATDVGGNKEIVVDGQTGFLVPPQNPDRLAEKIINILEDDARAEKMGIAGHQRVHEKFSLDVMLDEYLRVYEEVSK